MTASRRLVLRTAAVFLATYGVLIAAVLLGGQGLFERYVNPWTAKSTAWALAALGAQGESDGVMVQSTVTSFQIVSECTVLYPAVIFVAAVVAAPAPFRRKVAAAIWLPVLAFVNLVRIVSLAYIHHWFPGSLETAHFVVWPSLMIFFTLLAWILWATRATAVRDTARA